VAGKKMSEAAERETKAIDLEEEEEEEEDSVGKEGRTNCCSDATTTMLRECAATVEW
jgi:hypothetical protein